MAVPIWGQACDYNELENLAQRHNLKLIFDAQIGLVVSNSYIGGFGDAEVFSFMLQNIFQPEKAA